jgi:hypothetical protein
LISAPGSFPFSLAAPLDFLKNHGAFALLPIQGEMSLDAADKVCDAIADFYGKK